MDSKIFGAFTKSVGGVDWDALHSQKQGLQELADFLSPSRKDGDSVLDDWGKVVEGIINFIDTLQDDAADVAHIWEFPIDKEGDSR